MNRPGEFRRALTSVAFRNCRTFSHFSAPALLRPPRVYIVAGPGEEGKQGNMIAGEPAPRTTRHQYFRPHRLLGLPGG
jgi:hypothetical protein